jgi:GDP-L-fucose synthase
MEFKGKLVFDNSKPDGTMRKLLGVCKIKAVGWKAEVDLDKGFDITIKNYPSTSPCNYY